MGDELCAHIGRPQDHPAKNIDGRNSSSILYQQSDSILYTFLSVERSELDRNYDPSVCDWLYSTWCDHMAVGGEGGGYVRIHEQEEKPVYIASACVSGNWSQVGSRAHCTKSCQWAWGVKEYGCTCTRREGYGEEGGVWVYMYEEGGVWGGGRDMGVHVKGGRRCYVGEEGGAERRHIGKLCGQLCNPKIMQ